MPFNSYMCVTLLSFLYYISILSITKASQVGLTGQLFDAGWVFQNHGSSSDIPDS